MGKKQSQVVAFDCSSFPSLSAKKTVANSTSSTSNIQNEKMTERANNITSLNSRQLFEQVQHSIDGLRSQALVGKQRRRFLEQVAIREGTQKLEKAPRVPAKILSGMRKKAKKREVRSREEVKAMGGAGSSHLLTNGTIRVQKYEMRGKEARGVKERERGLMLTHGMKKRETQKPRLFKPPK